MKCLPSRLPKAPSTRETRRCRAEPESDAVVGLEIVRGQILETRGDLAGVVEDGAVHGREDLPAVFRLEQQHVTVAEPGSAEAAQIVGAAERPLKIERDLAPRLGIGRRDERVERQDAPIIQYGNVLLQVRFHALERIAIAVAVVELLERHGVSAAAARIAARLPVVQVGKQLITEEIRLSCQPGCRLVVEDRANPPAFAQRAHMWG